MFISSRLIYSFLFPVTKLVFSWNVSRWQIWVAERNIRFIFAKLSVSIYTYNHHHQHGPDLFPGQLKVHNSAGTTTFSITIDTDRSCLCRWPLTSSSRAGTTSLTKTLVVPKRETLKKQRPKKARKKEKS